MPAARQCSCFSFAGTTGGGEEPRDLELYHGRTSFRQERALSLLSGLVWRSRDSCSIPVSRQAGYAGRLPPRPRMDAQQGAAVERRQNAGQTDWWFR